MTGEKPRTGAHAFFLNDAEKGFKVKCNAVIFVAEAARHQNQDAMMGAKENGGGPALRTHIPMTKRHYRAPYALPSLQMDDMLSSVASARARAAITAPLAGAQPWTRGDGDPRPRRGLRLRGRSPFPA